MANIPIQEAQGEFTKALQAVYKDMVPAPGFLRSFFPNRPPSPTKNVSIMVQRGSEKVAVDVARGSQGNRNQWTRTTEKIIEPPYYRENFDLTSLELYDRYWGSAKDGSISDSVLGSLVMSVAEKQAELQAMIERAMEIQCAQIFKDGKIVSISGGTGFEIDYKRDSDSMYDPGAGEYWANNKDLFAQIERGCQYLRQKGKYTGWVFNFILGSTAKKDMNANTVFTGRQNLFHMNLDNVLPPQRTAQGATFHGWISCGSYMVNLWTYDEYYEDANGDMQPYIDPKQGILLPNKPNFITAFGAVPQVVQPGQAPRVGQFIFSDWISADKRTHNYDVESCPLAIPVAVQQMWTIQAVAP